MLKTIGGDRLGSGNKMKTELHNYERSTHDISQVTRTTMAVGALTPVLKIPVMNGDTLTINTSQLIRTMPAIGPCFGSFKFQCDIFEVPCRLYQGLLHNNATRIGMNMNQVKLPIMTIHDTYNEFDRAGMANAFNKSSLLAYLGLSGIGGKKEDGEQISELSRDFQAVPLLGYYDIFKNYYANKQEQKAYVIANDVNILPTECDSFKKLVKGSTRDKSYMRLIPFIINNTDEHHSDLMVTPSSSTEHLTLFNGCIMEWYFDGPIVYQDNYYPSLIVENGSGQAELLELSPDQDIFQVEYSNKSLKIKQIQEIESAFVTGLRYFPSDTINYETKLQPFNLDYIDKMRTDILRATEIGTTFNITDDLYAPYSYGTGRVGSKDDWTCTAKAPLQGLVVKTYQSDYFNNWLSAEWIDGLNGINEITAVNTESGKFTIDALNLAHKVYNMLNRIAISGGTYEDWQEAVWGEDAIRRAETPVYLGGCSSIITFEEVVSTADTLTETAGDQPLGSLAGKGTVVGQKGGNIEIHVKEPGYIMAIASITPLIDYCQGNDFDLTEIWSLDDFHKPELDQIGFQNLLLERAVFWGTQYDTQEQKWVKLGTGKIPAWVDYMTNVNKVYGDFADELNFMVLTRNYEAGNKLWDGTNKVLPVRDFTTYIDPSKYNNAFANTSLSAQNFWVQIGFNIIARRKMSAKIIPNL